MTELKTLKDCQGYELSDFGIFEDAVLISELKAEAVKWVKTKFNLKYTLGCGLSGGIGWLEFKHFFNLTEEDLQNYKEVKKQ